MPAKKSKKRIKPTARGLAAAKGRPSDTFMGVDSKDKKDKPTKKGLAAAKAASKKKKKK